MAKKKSHDISDVSAAETSIAQELASAEEVPSDAAESVEEPGHPLMEEVQSFLNLRDELARKLAAEIEMMEEKLAELKRTAASLFPSGDADSAADRKAKKPKPKPAAPKDKSGTASVANTESEPPAEG